MGILYPSVAEIMLLILKMCYVIITYLKSIGENMKMNKKGFMQDLGALGIGVVSLVIILAVAFLILAQVKANASVLADGNATAAVNTLTTAAATIPNF